MVALRGRAERPRAGQVSSSGQEDESSACTHVERGETTAVGIEGLVVVVGELPARRRSVS